MNGASRTGAVSTGAVSGHSTTCLLAALTLFITAAIGLARSDDLPDQSDDNFSICPSGFVYAGGLCLENCQPPDINAMYFCRSQCMEGGYFTDWASICYDNGVPALFYIPVTKIRQLSRVKNCHSRSFTRAYNKSQLEETDDQDFTMVVTSDTQFPWWRGATDPDCRTPHCILEKGLETNRNQIQAMNGVQQVLDTTSDLRGYWPVANTTLEEGLGDPVAKPRGLIINGDLTAFFHPWQIWLFQSYYQRSDQNNTEQNIYDLYPGLGNHDLDNNKNDCYWTASLYDVVRYGSTGCAIAAMRFIRSALNCNTISNFNARSVESFDNASLAWSWNIGRWHFVQLNFYPEYSNPAVGLESPIKWLEQDLARATARNQWIVINYHRSKEGSEFINVVKRNNVVLIITAHKHSKAGLIKNLKGTSIPIIKSGVPEYSSFALLRFTNDYFNLEIIDSSNGVAKFLAPDHSRYSRTFYPSEIIGLSNDYSTP